MKSRFLIFLIMLMPVFLFSNNIDSLYKKGIKALNKKEFDSAIKIFKKIEDIKKSPGVYYNLALTYWEKGDKGLTIFYLKKSLKLFPLYRRAKKALVIIDKQAKSNEKTFLVYILSLVTSLLLLFTIQILIYKSYLLKKKIKIFSLILLIMFFSISIAIFYKSGYSLFKEKKGIIVKKVEVNVFSEPDYSSIPLYKLSEGEEVKIITLYGGWYKISKDNILLGWVKGENLKIY